MDSELIQLLLRLRETLLGSIGILQDPRNINTFFYIGSAFTLVSFAYLVSRFLVVSRLVVLVCFCILTGLFALGVDGNLASYMTNISVELIGAFIAIVVIYTVFALDRSLFVILWGALSFVMLLTIEYNPSGSEFFMNAATELLGIFMITLLLEQEAFSGEESESYNTQLWQRLRTEYLRHRREDTDLHVTAREAGEIRIELVGMDSDELDVMVDRLAKAMSIVGLTDDFDQTNDLLVYRYALATLPEVDADEPENIVKD